VSAHIEIYRYSHSGGDIRVQIAENPIFSSRIAYFTTNISFREGVIASYGSLRNDLKMLYLAV
jgi:hypothetical protein